MLLQEGDDGKMHLVYRVSKKTNDAERTYHSSKLELLAIIWCIERLLSLLLGIPFTVISDCQALVYLNAKKILQPQIARWYATLSEYDFEIKHRSGERMSHVDSLSRAAVEPADPQGMTEEVYEKRLDVYQIITEEDRITMIQNSDPKLRELIRSLKTPEDDRTQEEKNRVKDYEVEDYLGK